MFKNVLIASLFSIMALPVAAQQTPAAYNKQLADSLGADAYGMKKYVFVILKTGPVVVKDKKVTDSLFAGHLGNIGRLAGEGKLVVAGPMGKNDKQYRGIFILAAKDKTEAEAWLGTDPAVKAGLLAAELYDWYGSAALPAYLGVHAQIEQQKP